MSEVLAQGSLCKTRSGDGNLGAGCLCPPAAAGLLPELLSTPLQATDNIIQLLSCPTRYLLIIL